MDFTGIGIFVFGEPGIHKLPTGSIIPRGITEGEFMIFTGSFILIDQCGDQIDF